MVTYSLFQTAVTSFANLINKDITHILDATLLDALENGKLQKFEYTIELCWKYLKNYLREQEGIETTSPKQAIKQTYLTQHINEDSYLKLIDMINDRNAMSHIYDEAEFKIIIAKFQDYAQTFQHILEKVKT